MPPGDPAMRAPALTPALRSRLTSALLLSALLTTSSTACGEKDGEKAPATTPSSTAASTSTGPAAASGKKPAASGDSAGPRDLDAGQGGGRPKTNNPAPTSTGTPSAGLSPIAVVAAEGKAVVMSEGRRATLRMDPTQTFWDGKHLLLSFRDGQRVYGPGDAIWWQPGQVPGHAANLGAVLQASGQLGSWLEVETLQSGQHRVWANISGQRHRLGIFKEAPTASVLLLAPTGAAVGAASPRLGKASGFQFDGSSAPKDALPTDATAAPDVVPDKDQAQAWRTELSTLRGAEVTATWSRMVDMDRDGEAEGVTCVTGGKDDYDCYVVESQDGNRRYFGLTGFEVKAGGTAPRAFTYKDGTYLMLLAGAESPALWVARYDGTRFLAEGVR